MLFQLAKKLNEQDISISFEQVAITAIAKNGYNEEFGARPLRRYIQDNIDDILAKKILSGEFSRGDRVIIGFDSSSNLVINKQS